VTFPSLVQQPLGERVAHELRVRIIGGSLERGAHLVEGSLAEQFAVSRGPVRDALRQLESEGLLESRKRGVFVVGLDEGDVEEIYTLREALEALALSVAAERAGAHDWKRAEECVAEMRAAADEADPHRFAAADMDFHGEFYRLSGHRRLRSVWEQYRPTFTVLLDITNAQDVDLHPAADAHFALLRDVRAGDTEQAVARLREHLAGSSRRLRKAMAGIRQQHAEC
jgi:GntR family transcriptional regulator, gluconate operon transcriptional repressor